MMVELSHQKSHRSRSESHDSCGLCRPSTGHELNIRGDAYFVARQHNHDCTQIDVGDYRTYVGGAK